MVEGQSGLCIKTTFEGVREKKLEEKGGRREWEKTGEGVRGRREERRR